MVKKKRFVGIVLQVHLYMLDEVYFFTFFFATIICSSSKMGKGKLCQMAEKKSWENNINVGKGVSEMINENGR